MHVYDCRAYDKTADEGEGEGEEEEEEGLLTSNE